MISTELLSAKWGLGLDYAAYLATGTPEQQARWNRFHAAVAMTPAQRELLEGFVRPVRVLVVSGIWCGDCVEQVPFLDHFRAAAGGKVECRYVDRDVHKDLSSQLKLCGGDRVPVVLFLSEDLDLLGIAGDRSISRYRAKAARELGAACPTGLVLPPTDEMAATCADWLADLERAQLMVRLSPRYRRKYQD